MLEERQPGKEGLGWRRETGRQGGALHQELSAAAKVGSHRDWAEGPGRETSNLRSSFWRHCRKEVRVSSGGLQLWGDQDGLTVLHRT